MSNVLDVSTHSTLTFMPLLHIYILDVWDVGIDTASISDITNVNTHATYILWTLMHTSQYNCSWVESTALLLLHILKAAVFHLQLGSVYYPATNVHYWTRWIAIYT